MVFGDHKGHVKSVAITSDGKHAVSASGDGAVRYWDLDDHRLLINLKLAETPVHCVALSPAELKSFAGAATASCGCST